MRLKNKKIIYVLIGGINTLFGYGISLLFFLWLSDTFLLPVILIFASLFSISFSFVTYKIFVFQTQGGWAKEYLKCYLVYGSSMVFSIIATSLIVEILMMDFWIAQGIVLFFTVIASYLLHENFTFKK